MDFIKDLLPESIKSIPTHMDFDGQRQAERTFQIIIVLFGIIGFIYGYICQQFSWTMYILLAGFALSCFLTLPPWPMYRQQPLNWQKAKKIDMDGNISQSNEKRHKKKDKTY